MSTYPDYIRYSDLTADEQEEVDDRGTVLRADGSTYKLWQRDLHGEQWLKNLCPGYQATCVAEPREIFGVPRQSNWLGRAVNGIIGRIGSVRGRSDD